MSDLWMNLFFWVLKRTDYSTDCNNIFESYGLEYIARMNNFYDSLLTVMVLFEAWRLPLSCNCIKKRPVYSSKYLFWTSTEEKVTQVCNELKVSKWFHELSCMGELYFTVWDHFHVSSWFLEPYSVRCYIIGADCSHWISTFMFLMRRLSKPNTFPVTVFLSRRRYFLAIFEHWTTFKNMFLAITLKLNSYMMSSKNGCYICDTLKNLPWPCLDLTPFHS